MTEIRVHYYGPLREAAGRDDEALDTDAPTAHALYRELSARYGFTLTPTQIMVAINDQFAPAESPLRTGDAVVFIPPIAGG